MKTRKEILSAIEKLSLLEIAKIAWSAQNDIQNGYCILNLNTLKISGNSLQPNESNAPGIDSNYINLLKCERGHENSDEDEYIDWVIENGLNFDEISEEMEMKKIL